eukprot:tig00020563_g11228.t1
MQNIPAQKRFSFPREQKRSQPSVPGRSSPRDELNDLDKVLEARVLKDLMRDHPPRPATPPEAVAGDVLAPREPREPRRERDPVRRSLEDKEAAAAPPAASAAAAAHRDLPPRPRVHSNPHAAAGAGAGGPVRDSDLLSSMAQRLRNTELQLKSQRSELQIKDQLIAQLQKELATAREVASSGAGPQDKVKLLQTENARLRKQVRDMERFLNDYGMIWVGNGSESEDEGAARNGRPPRPGARPAAASDGEDAAGAPRAERPARKADRDLNPMRRSREKGTDGSPAPAPAGGHGAAPPAAAAAPPLKKLVVPFDVNVVRAFGAGRGEAGRGASFIF